MNGKTGKHGRYRKMIALCFWIVLFLILLSQRDKLTVENIVNYSPQNMLLAIVVVLLIYGVKGCTMLINGYILYIAVGIMFPAIGALVINLMGSVIMITIPFWMGRRGGAAMLDKLTAKYKKLEALRDKPKQNERLTAFLLRILGVLPCEMVSLFLGACELHYGKYLIGSLMGLVPSMIACTIMGEYAAMPGSPQFIIAAAIWLIGAGSGLILNYMEKRINEECKIMQRFSRTQILTIPNALSVLRILLIPVIWVLYGEEQYWAAAWVIFLSGLTDIIDGRIARRYNMISDLGKVLDPVADKLTQGVLIICLTIKYPGMVSLVIIFALAEMCKLIMGYITMRKYDSINSAKWYGKVTTVLLYTAMIFLILFPGISATVANVIIMLCRLAVIASCIMYVSFYVQFWRSAKS